VKATIDIPDDLYRKVKAKTALEGRRVRDVTVELYQRWLDEGARGHAEDSPEAWLRSWLALADEALKNAPPGPSAREILATDRNRLEPG
jgi:predicted transcriptional regulator YdeE